MCVGAGDEENKFLFIKKVGIWGGEKITWGE